MKYQPKSKISTLPTSLESILSLYREERNFSSQDYINNKADRLNKYLAVSGLSSCVVAVSGGIDSAITLGIAVKASQKEDSPIKKIIPVTLPCFDKGATNQKESIIKADKLCEHFGLSLVTMEVTQAMIDNASIVEKALGQNGKGWARGQLVAYSRTPILYYITSLLSESGTPGVILGTNNKDEGAYLGYFGKASDGMVDIQLISDIHKSEVYAVANSLGIPEELIEATPAGDMYDGREDSDVFGAPYDFVELYLAYLEGKVDIKNLSREGKEIFSELATNLEALHSYNAHKYISCSPSVHLDLDQYEYEIPNGWKYTNYKGA